MIPNKHHKCSSPESNWACGPLYRSLLPSTESIVTFQKIRNCSRGQFIINMGSYSIYDSRALGAPHLPLELHGSGYSGDDGTGQVATDEMASHCC